MYTIQPLSPFPINFCPLGSEFQNLGIGHYGIIAMQLFFFLPQTAKVRVQKKISGYDLLGLVLGSVSITFRGGLRYSRVTLSLKVRVNKTNVTK